MIYFILFISFCFLLFFPKLFVLIYLLIRHLNSKQNNSVLFQISDFFIFSYFALSFAVMLANRPYYIGFEAGFGEDMLHYYNAFDWISGTDWLSFFKGFSTITGLTGSAEPLFWIIIKVITCFFEQDYYIHLCLTFLGFFLIYISGQIWNKVGLLFVFLYTNTITSFAFQGSAIRSGLAFSVALLGYVFLLKNKYKFINFLSPLIHFSMIPMPLITYMGYTNYKKPINIIYLSLFFVFFGATLYYFSMKSMDAGLGAKLSARLSENDLDFGSLMQFLFESIFTIFLSFFIFKSKIEKPIRVSLISFFMVTLMILVVSPSAFARFYRYEYIFFILIYSSIFLRSNWKLKFFILFLSISWFIFLGLSRYVGVFSDNFLNFLNFNLFYSYIL